MHGKLIFEKGKPGRKAVTLPGLDVPKKAISELVPGKFLRKSEPHLPEVSEVEIVRHFTKLSQKNFSIDTHFYPLGSCTMKYNPKINEDIVQIPGFSDIHPYQPEETSQGILQLLYEMEQMLKEICGMDRFTFQPAAGAHGELLGLMLARAYHAKKGRKCRKVIVPDSSHGTNPASAAISGYEVVSIKSNERGEIDLDELKKAMDNEVAALMLTSPNTLGLFESQILEVKKIAHSYDALLYYDGANLNPLLGICSPGDMGFDIVHLNLHKTFSTPHGGGGPGSGPVGVKKKLARFLPVPIVEKEGDGYKLNYELPDSIGRIRGFYGNIGVVIKAYAYIKALGRDGLAKVGKASIINANYLLNKLKDKFKIPYDKYCMHEFVVSAAQLKKNGVTALDIAKSLIDKGFHPPTIYFPLIVAEAMMIEPTETETRETLDAFADAMNELVEKAVTDPESLHDAPRTTPVTRLDEVKAARQPVLRWRK